MLLTGHDVMRADENQDGAWSNPGMMDGDDSYLAVYQQNWWMDCVRAHEDISEVTVRRADAVVGRLASYMRRTKAGFAWGGNLAWSHLGGPILSRELGAGDQTEVLDELLAQLPRRNSYNFTVDSKLSYSELVKQAFLRAGFAHSTQTTYLRRPGTADVLSALKSKHRTHLKAAARTLEVVELNGDEFVQLYGANLAAQDIKSYAPLAIVKGLIDAGISAERQQMRVTAARMIGVEEPLDAAIACTWDQRRYYFWLSTRRRPSDTPRQSAPHPNAIKLLAMDAMRHAQELGLTFDADGVTTAGSAHLYRNIFGLTEEETRDVFTRSAVLAQLYEDHRPALNKIVDLLT